MSIVCAILMIMSINHAVAVEQAAEAQPASQSDVPAVVLEKIDINQADAAMLATLPGIGPKMAGRIDAYRAANGPFESVDELLNIKGIGPQEFEKIKSLVTVS